MKLKTINIHGKEYVQVKDKVQHFRKTYKNWSLTSDFVELTENRCVIKAEVKNEDGRVIADGIAEETKGSSHINKSSFIENCQTSAWGRALSNLGIGVETSISSFEEVSNAIEQQKDNSPDKLNNDKYQAMIVAIGEGKTEVVKNRMKNYKLSSKQKTTLEKLIKEAMDPVIQKELEVIKEFKNK